ncbi:MAG: hypothetical protein LCH95_19530 [Proteobacteria bacterium]|nr:hypothetical protein [Pseudomonadota bacterium]MCA0304604.1 hypothetical protein [Pseudomonadota bacterium]
MKFRVAIFASALGILSSCGPMSSGRVQDLNVKDWIGHSAQHLEQSWGAPNHTDPMPDGGRTLAYVIVNQAVTGPKSQIMFRAQKCVINFTVAANGIIDDANATGSNCRIGPHGDMHPPTSKT